MEMVYGRPYPDKLCGVEFFQASPQEIGKVVALNSPATMFEGLEHYRRAMPVLQICQPETGYAFIEFWSTVGKKLGDAVQFLENYMGKPVVEDDEDDVEETPTPPAVPGVSVPEPLPEAAEPVTTTSGENMSQSGTD